MLTNRIILLLALLCPLTFFSCQDEEHPLTIPKASFRSIGLEQRIVNELNLHNNTLYAATDAGLFSKSLTTDGNWQSTGLAGKNVKAFVALNISTFLAATADPALEDFKLYRSNDSGQSWQEVNSNWGNGAPESLNDFAYDASSNTLYACGWGVVAKSNDQGLSWVPAYGEWQTVASGLAFVDLNPLNGTIWTGGQNAIEGFRLAKKATASEQWQEWTNLLPSPSVAKKIAFHPSDPQTILIGGEDGIIRTTNGGANWTTIKQDHEARFYFGLSYDPDENNRIYATSWVKNFDDPQPLVLHISEDGGNSWWEFQHASPSLFGGAWDMVQRKEDHKTKLYIGLYKGGVYEATIE